MSWHHFLPFINRTNSSLFSSHTNAAPYLCHHFPAPPCPANCVYLPSFQTNLEGFGQKEYIGIKEEEEMLPFQKRLKRFHDDKKKKTFTEHHTLENTGNITGVKHARRKLHMQQGHQDLHQINIVALQAKQILRYCVRYQTSCVPYTTAGGFQNKTPHNKWKLRLQVKLRHNGMKE